MQNFNSYSKGEEKKKEINQTSAWKHCYVNFKFICQLRGGKTRSFNIFFSIQYDVRDELVFEPNLVCGQFQNILKRYS